MANQSRGHCTDLWQPPSLGTGISFVVVPVKKQKVHVPSLPQGPKPLARLWKNWIYSDMQTSESIF